MRPSVSHPMDFFAHQDRARRNTLLLLFYFVLAVALIIVAVYLAIVLIFFGIEVKTESDLATNPWSPSFFLWVVVLTSSIVVAGSVYKILVLSKGGEAVARLLDARPINTNTSDLKERRLLNVVEEMAIASGLPVPTVYLLEKDRSINAFAAGFAPPDAIIGVTRGTVDLLPRDELQGVIAHEFSHIFNGDMRLNIRLMGVLHGILVIALIGYGILRGSRVSGGRKGGGSAILLFGGALFVIGYVGVFFAKLIKSAVSRQREFLADASAVQFTRNPDGIAGALRKIGGLTYGSKIQSPRAEEVSHFFFADGLKSRIRLHYLSTHPPLEDRIRRIDPAFDGKYPKIEYESLESVAEPVPPEGRIQEDARISVVPQRLTELIGKLTKSHLMYAAALVSAMPKRLVDHVHEPSGARAVVFSLLLSPDSQVRQAQFRALHDASKDPRLSTDTLELSSQVERLPPQARLPLLDMAVPALRRLSPNQHKEFRALIDRMIMADRKCDLFEFTVLHVLRRHLDRSFRESPPPSVRYTSFAPLITECSLLLSSLAHAGHGDETHARRAFAHGAEEVEEVGGELTFQARQDCSLPALSKALQELALVAPKLKRQVLRACGAAVGHDHLVAVQEAELLRAVADALDCPLPPFLTSPGFQFGAKDREEETN